MEGPSTDDPIEFAGSELFADILGAPDRDPFPVSRPVVSFRPDDDAEFLDAIESRASLRVRLMRRGIEHGEWAEVDADDLVQSPGVPLDALMAQRWHTARPIVVRGACEPREAFGEEIGDRRRLHDELREEGGLRRFLRTAKPELEPEFQVQGRPASLFDAERDIERAFLTWCPDHDDPKAPHMRDLWVKSSWLSTHDEDESMRMRISFGDEGGDDANRDIRRHRRATELAEALLPECALVHEHPILTGLIDDFVGAETFFTQHIAYWNAPGGGALFHHDAFDEDAIGGQKGVLYVQLTGRTAWLALSIEDLTRRVIEFAEYLQEGELPWVTDRLFRRDGERERFFKMTGDFMRVRRELAKPGCGRLGKVVNRGPEFTSLLADAGHATILGAGDAILLPNHGYRDTAMHSVFCASEVPAFGLSMAIREAHPPPLPPPPEDSPGGDARPGRGRGRRGRPGRGRHDKGRNR